MPLAVHGRVPAERLAALERFLEGQTTTEAVFRAIDGLDLTMRVVAMDEYTLDLVVALPDDLWLVYDTT